MSSPTRTAPSQTAPNGKEPWLLTQTHMIGTSSHGDRCRSTTVISSAMQIRPNSRGRGVQKAAPTPTAVRPASAVRSGDPVRARRTTSQTSRATSRACSNTTSSMPPIRNAQP